MEDRHTLSAALPADHPIDTSVEEPYLLSEVGKHLPGRPGYRTVYGYCTVGMRHCRNRDRYVRLQTVTIGGRLHTSVEAYHRMVAEANR